MFLEAIRIARTWMQSDGGNCLNTLGPGVKIFYLSGFIMFQKIRREYTERQRKHGSSKNMFLFQNKVNRFKRNSPFINPSCASVLIAFISYMSYNLPLIAVQ